MSVYPRFLHFAWWNLHNFAHFDAAKSSLARWPNSVQDYEAKRDRILAALHEVFGKKRPHLLAFCEITKEAARDLANRLPGDYRVALPPIPGKDEFQVAVFYRSGLGFTPELPIIPSDQEDIREGTRPMLPIHLAFAGHLIRFVACHWTAFDYSSSRIARERLADVLKRDSYQFLRPPVPTPGLARHLVILGDLNEEPTAPVFRERLIGCRDRESSRIRHRDDEGTQRVRLYDAAWRYLGEKIPHGLAGWPVGAAGTLYNDSTDKDTKGWKTFDHLLVSAGLLGMTPPYLDEAKTGIVSTPSMRDRAVGPLRPWTGCWGVP